ncbi:MAG: thioredoxin fold domain-containing protein [Symploca sp. SIO3C6]|uniref:Thioredoxin fold domain-containing protein n=1 Tax=Symploca sp. SIO1C4 TaxID=2607765 RepID=A0A6B3NDJ3_9CYAN|nr:thioredoxin fold domain-containing protein [Symploca sp. SIO3C6]NER27701.1 thioredoxin fold domain-containing protein [Symploca sp. SIO1C4]NET06562.1 thioredoxin fold domain-containing protein [Symploca sp. SIO2B6]
MTANSSDSETTSLQKSEISSGTRIRNFLIAMVAIALGVTLFLGLKTETGVASLEAQAKEATPLPVALSSGKPTLMEFYANWCSTCQAMAQDLGELKQEYADSVNFVMLNVDNSKWLPEILNYRVDGIPHFVFLGEDGQVIAQTIGEQPKTILKANLDALVASLPLPYTQGSGEVSTFESPVSTQTTSQDDPRSHGAQVKQ